MLYQDLIKTRQVKAGKLLPPVFPLVLYNGMSKWTAKREVAELITPISPSLARYRPSQRYFILDEGRVEAKSLTGQPSLAGFIVRLEQAESPEDFQKIVGELKEKLQGSGFDSLRRALSTWMTRVLLHRFDENILETSDLLEVESMIEERVDIWKENWKREGLQKGRQEGLQEGLQEGRQKGLREGEKKGEGNMLILQLKNRFPSQFNEQAQRRVQSASPDQLQTWGLRILKAKSLDEVFNA